MKLEGFLKKEDLVKRENALDELVEIHLAYKPQEENFNCINWRNTYQMKYFNAVQIFGNDQDLCYYFGLKLKKRFQEAETNKIYK